MVNIEVYIESLITILKHSFGERLLYVGLQGSYLRGEATEDSDIDIMVIIDALSVYDLDTYRAALISAGNFEKSCGFISGKEELAKWNPLEVCHLLYCTKDYFGVLADLIPSFTDEDVLNYVKISLNNLFHEICHGYIHSDLDENIARLPYAYKAVFFILQNIYYIENGVFVGTKKQLISLLSGMDKSVLETSMKLAQGERYDFKEAFSLLFTWCRETMIRDFYKNKSTIEPAKSL